MYKQNVIKHAWSFLIRYLPSYFAKDRFTPMEIPRLSIETTNICDARCVFCANAVMKRPRTHLEMPMFQKVVKEYAEMGGNEIDFNCVVGDPLLDPLLLQRIRYVRSFAQFKVVGFVTNLQWLHRFDLTDFLNSGITWIAISMTLSGREKYREFFGVDRYENTLRNIMTLIDENNKLGNRIKIMLSVKPTNESTNDVKNHPDYKMVKSRGDAVFVLDDFIGSYVDDWCGTITLPSYLKKRPLYPRAFRPCRLFYSKLMIFSNGSIGVCICRDFENDEKLILGNLKNDTLHNAWTGEKLSNLRHSWRNRNRIPRLCALCRHYLY